VGQVDGGTARGVDTAARKGTREARGKMVAVRGTGMDVIYPKENKRLAEPTVESGGAIVSEYPLRTFPAPENLPVRNRHSERDECRGAGERGGRA
jgi:DNA processing protein